MSRDAESQRQRQVPTKLFSAHLDNQFTIYILDHHRRRHQIANQRPKNNGSNGAVVARSLSTQLRRGFDAHLAPSGACGRVANVADL